MLSVKQVADLMGTTPETVRHYTATNFLTPTVNPLNHYSSYRLADALELGHVRSMRSLDLSLHQIDELQQMASEDQLAALECHQASLASQIEELQHTLSRLNQVIAFVKKTELCHGVVEDVMRPPIYSLYTTGVETEKKERQRLMAQWMEKLPFTHISISLPMAQLNAPNFTGKYAVRLGVGMTEEYRDKLGLTVEAPVETVPAGRFLLLYLKTQDPLSLTTNDMRPLLEKAKELNVRFLNDSTGRLLTIEEDLDGVRVYNLLVRVRIG